MTEPQRPPRDNLIRANQSGIEMRSTEEAKMPTLIGHLAVFDQWTEINSSWEGNFLERIAPGAFTKTIKENRDSMRVLFNHGQDPSIGDKVLGPIGELREDGEGAFYEVPLMDTSYNRDLIPGLELGLYGNSFRFGVMKESFNQRPKASEYNPEAIPERTVQELRMVEFGPVTFPAYKGATGGLRSLTDDFILRQLMGDPDRLRELLSVNAATALPVVGAESSHSSKEAAPVAAIVPVTPRFRSREDYLEWLTSKI